MKTSAKLLAILLSLCMVIFCAVGLTACGDKECDHQWGEWSTKTEATCTEKGVQERECSECGETDTSKIDKLDHVDGDDKDHLCDYGCGKTADDGCYDTAKDGKCDECGAAIKHTCVDADNNLVCDICSAAIAGHADANKDHACDCGCSKRFGEHSDSATDKDHVCDYGCKAVFENCFDTEEDSDHNCDICGSANTTAHSYTLTASTEATCDAAATNTYVCYCGDSYTDKLGDALGHSITGVTPVEKFVSGCEFVLVYDCQRCGKEVEGESIYRHNHIARITTPATCSKDGVKTLTCACGDTYTETIAKNTTGHNWVTGTVVNGVRTDTCSVCSGTKTVTVYSGTTTDKVNANDLANKEIELNNANISLDNGVIDSIGNQNVTVSADKVEGNDRTGLGLSDDQLAQVGDSPIYNFTINNGSENISNFGEDNWVTITLPYILSDDEDVDSIAIWFINDNGDLEAIQATYNNGFVTFKTNHFSYYTVTRLTPAERCALYGHGYACQHVEGSCTKDGYDLYVCVRCHDRYIDESTLVIADGHDYESSRQEATCTTDGNVTYTCKDCGHSYSTKLTAGGHVYSLKASADATCTADGYTKYGCDLCGAEYTLTRARLPHNFVNGVCAACGETDGSCDHKTLTTVSIDMGKQGACNWVLQYETCTCGQVKKLDPDAMDDMDTCDIKTVDQNVTTDENGNMHATVTGRCATCGLDIEARYTRSAAGCVETMQMWYTFKFNNVTIVADLYLEYTATYHEDTTYTVINLSEYGACGGTIEAWKCNKCGAIDRIDDWEPTCIDPEAEPTPEQVTDKDGIVHTIQKVSCPTCGLEMSTDRWEVASNACVTEGHQVTTLRCGETIIYEETRNYQNGEHDYTFEYELKGTSCEDGVVVTESCSVCGYHYQYTSYYHNTNSSTIDLTQKGACQGEIRYSVCACGQESRFYAYDLCGEWNHNSYYDDAGRLVEVETHTCNDCGLRYTYSYYSIKNAGTCTETTYYTKVLNIGNTLVQSAEYTETDNYSHDFVYTATLLGGEGASCEDGVQITASCATCGTTDSYTTDYHSEFEKERIDLSKYGSVCGGYATIRGCACGYYTHVNLDHSLCELGEESCSPWIDGTITGSYYTENEYSEYFSHYAYLYTCAVTSPKDAACGYKIRHAEYWLKDKNSCVAHRYETWQFGYNETTGKCLYEITIKTDSRTYHNYVDTGEDGNTKLDCPDCGSSYYINRFYNEQTSQEIVNTYCNQIYSDGTQYQWESHGVVSKYTGPFGDNGSKTEYSWSDSNGDRRTEESASVSYKGRSFTIYRYSTEGNYWYRYDYTYSFDPINGCVQTTLYTNSDGDRNEYSDVICESWNAIITDVKTPTCSQDGERWEECRVCGKHGEPYTVEATDHNWVRVNDTLYYCFACGLENANGVSGDIILEDLTEAYGNGQYYVVGYYARNNVSFSQYISLILDDGTEIAIWSGIDITAVDGLRAFKFSKAAVEAWAAQNGYSNYQVKFSFVPVGSDGSFDYGVTFSERQYYSTITGDVSFTDYIGVGETKAYTIAPTKDGYWTFTSFADNDTVAELYDANGNHLYYSDDDGDGNNFKITYWLNAGETYTIYVRWYSSDRVGYTGLLFEAN